MITTTRTAMVSLAETLVEEGQTAQAAIEAGNTTFLGKDAKQYAADRFARARKVLDLMMTKLPAKVSPYAVQMGQHIAQTYAVIGKLSGDTEATNKAVALLEQEIMRYADYCRYYQSLSPSMYGRITNIDRFINERYMPWLLGDYVSLAGQDKGEALAKKVQARGVNIDRLLGTLQQQEQ